MKYNNNKTLQTYILFNIVNIYCVLHLP